MNSNPFLVRVITNQNGLYALWAVNRAIPPGWWDVGKGGTTEECLAFIDARDVPLPAYLTYLLTKKVSAKSA